MIKRNKWRLLVSSAIILLPALAGLLLWDMLPERVVTHWGFDGAADGWSDRSMLLWLPLLILAIDWVCLAVTAADPRNREQSPKAFGLVLWICPVVSLLSSGIIYASALGVDFEQERLLVMVIGAAFVAIGNYLPKVKLNHTIGIKTPWAVQREANWAATHRFGGRVWVCGGLAVLACALLPEPWMAAGMAAVLAVLVAAPTLYSWRYYRRQRQAGAQEAVEIAGLSKVSLALTAVVLVGVGVLIFSGDISVNCGNASFTVRASYWEDITVEYAEVDSIEYREEKVPGSRTNGFGSPRLQVGIFQNEEMGSYTRYTYTGCGAAVVLQTEGGTLVLSGRDAEQTRALYKELLEKLS